MSTKPEKITVIGHKNPDTDSICSAIAYAYMHNQLGEETYVPCRAGSINSETAYVLNRFGFDVPELILDIRPRISDLNIHTVPGVSRQATQRKAWELMRDNSVHSLPVLDGTKLEGIISVADIAIANMDSFVVNNLADAAIPVSNLLDTLNGTLLAGDPNAVLNKGKFVVGSGNADAMAGFSNPGDVIIVSNRLEAQITAIDIGASCVIVCGHNEINELVIRHAAEKNTIFISTKYDTYTTCRLINQSVPVEHNMSEKIISFTPGTTVDDAREIMSRAVYHYFPVAEKDGEYVGLITKGDLIDFNRRKVVLVDHNEKSQCVDGIEETQLIAVIDHHRLGDLESSDPISFNSRPVGCTSTIIYGLFHEYGVEIPSNIAGIMLSAILSDTLQFRSPTCTDRDIRAAEALAAIAEVDIPELAEAMFDAGETLEGKTPVEVFNMDCKLLMHNGMKLIIAQGLFNSRANREKAKEMVRECIASELARTGADAAYYIATSIPDASSDVLFAGEHAALLLSDAFGIEIPGDTAVLPGVLSRKKQFTPKIMQVL